MGSEHNQKIQKYNWYFSRKQLIKLKGNTGIMVELWSFGSVNVQSQNI